MRCIHITYLCGIVTTKTKHKAKERKPGYSPWKLLLAAMCASVDAVLFIELLYP